jgi:hypothetical protein
MNMSQIMRRPGQVQALERERAGEIVRNYNLPRE